MLTVWSEDPVAVQPSTQSIQLDTMLATLAKDHHEGRGS